MVSLLFFHFEDCAQKETRSGLAQEAQTHCGRKRWAVKKKGSVEHRLHADQCTVQYRYHYFICSRTKPDLEECLAGVFATPSIFFFSILKKHKTIKHICGSTIPENQDHQASSAINWRT
jgi:hypothetical protein